MHAAAAAATTTTTLPSMIGACLSTLFSTCGLGNRIGRCFSSLFFGSIRACVSRARTQPFSEIRSCANRSLLRRSLPGLVLCLLFALKHEGGGADLNGLLPTSNANAQDLPSSRSRSTIDVDILDDRSVTLERERRENK